MDITLSVLSYVKGHILQLIFDIVGFAFIFTIMSAFLFWFCNKKGWTKINEKGPRWFIIIFALVSLTAGVSIGGVVGFKTGVLNITEKITDDSGRVIVEQGFVKAANFIGIDIHQKINIKSAKLFLNKLHKIKLLESDGWIGVSLNNYMHSMLLNPFVSNTNTYIDTLAPGSEIVPVQVIYSTWDDFNTKMKKETENKKNIWRISGLIALVLWILVPVSIVSTIRVLKNKVKGDTVKSEDAKESDCLSVKEAEQQINVVPFKETTDTKPDQIVMVEKSIFSNYKKMSYIALAVGIILQILAYAMQREEQIAYFLVFIMFVFYVYACWAFAKSKKRHGLLGVLGMTTFFGFIVIALIPAKKHL